MKERNTGTGERVGVTGEHTLAWRAVLEEEGEPLEPSVDWGREEGETHLQITPPRGPGQKRG